MKKFKATFWRGNPQLTNGGYKTTRTIEAKTMKAAERKAKKISNNTVYGSMTLLKIEISE